MKRAFARSFLYKSTLQCFFIVIENGGIMLYIWSYLKRYPKWLVLDFVAAIFFVVVNLGLPTVLARMIDEGINQGDQERLYFWGFIMLADRPFLCCWEINDQHGARYAE